jgi:hypothetical protein
LVMDFRALNPAMGSPDIAPSERLRCDMAFALALLHHLVYANYSNFELIVRSLSSVARKWLVVEFVGPEDRYLQRWAKRCCPWYNLDNFLAVLKKEFPSIELFPSNEESRKILLCER